MLQLTLALVFGEGASQTATTFTIEKSALRGLTPSASNHPEQLLAGIVNTAIQAFSGFLEDENGITVTSEIGEKVDYKNAYNFINLFWWKPYFKSGYIIHSAILQTLEPYAD
ncbi:hypothetical protein NIES4075_25080 [Tolypothrix sp. NIES-4075]|uniref:hypothetical protein n=1 Tax=Tolypothrix sp. NIES-4075 TaxID=2005459 RepID=UPI000B5C6350|nr:hypothetical protein [Tolypothrix sp. NIES-4075]GAX41535.1 hypothetical protein NIES4075_25080 [Tolypothrix sp. NIES-4075]